MSSEPRFARVHLERGEKFHFTASFPDLPHAASMTVDEQPPLGDGLGPNPAGLLATALGTCLSSSLVFCLSKAHIDPTSVRADVTAQIVRNDRGRFRIGGVDVDIAFEVDAQDAARVERCHQLFEDFCIVTESVRQGIPVNVRVDARERAEFVAEPQSA